MAEELGAVLFDMDGVLIDSARVADRLLVSAAESHGVVLTPSDLARLNGASGVQFLARYQLFLFLALVTLGCAEGSARLRKPPEGMTLVVGTTFRMGTDPAEVPRILESTGLESDVPLQSEIPGHLVSVRDFYFDVVDVTNSDFAEFVAANAKWQRSLVDSASHNGRYLEHWNDDGPPDDLLDHPVTFVTWYSATAYCESRGKRLPSEAEYEWAAQDPVTGGEYPWGDAAPTNERVSWGGNDIDGTVPVGSYPPNSRGLYDMAGNVWRFTSDPWRGSYAEMLAASELAGPDGPRMRRVVRGGSWGANAANLRVRYRDSHRPFDAREMVGFRCAASPEGG